MKTNAKIGALVDDGRELARRLLTALPQNAGFDWREHRAARWRQGAFGGEFVAESGASTTVLEDLLGIDEQKRLLVANTAQFVRGLPANNALLWGARGTGKSSLIHALLNHFAADGLRLVEVDKTALAHISAVSARLEGAPHRFLLFCDDLSFEAEDSAYKVLKSALEGAMCGQRENTLIYATSNRRHLMPERSSDNAGARHVDGELHESEAVEEKVSLSDRFGLWLSFQPLRQDGYLRVARHWLERLGRDHHIALAWNEEARQAALRWALARGGRSGRTALHFAKQHVGGALLRRAEAADGGVPGRRAD